MGAVDHLPKPFNPVVLRARVGACLENKRLHDTEVRHLAAVEAERRRADELLHVLLPAAIAAELMTTASVAPRRHEDVAVLFSDVVGFTRYCDHTPPEEVLANLQDLVAHYEEIALAHGLQKIKTIGDAFLAVAGVPHAVPDPVLAAARCGLEMVTAARSLPRVEWEVRVGIHCGPVVAGILGRRQYGYDVWGDTVNTAARVEHHGAVGAVTLSGTAWRRVADRCAGQPLGVVPAKGKANLELVRLVSAL
jgi:adenylate cyclase